MLQTKKNVSDRSWMFSQNELTHVKISLIFPCNYNADLFEIYLKYKFWNNLFLLNSNVIHIAHWISLTGLIKLLRSCILVCFGRTLSFANKSEDRSATTLQLNCRYKTIRWKHLSAACLYYNYIVLLLTNYCFSTTAIFSLTKWSITFAYGSFLVYLLPYSSVPQCFHRVCFIYKHNSRWRAHYYATADYFTVTEQLPVYYVL